MPSDRIGIETGLGNASPTVPKRRRLCVAFVDVVGFSSLMSEDEEGTYSKWITLRGDILVPQLESFGGRLIKPTGDGILAAFDHPTDGVRWSLSVQRCARVAREGLTCRIALNYCDVIQDLDDLSGDGVNIAARLQERVLPGGVIVTEAIRDAVAAESDISLRDLGNLALKNIPTPVRAFDLVTDGRPSHAQRKNDPQLPSVAVLPFDNLSGGQADDYFADGIVEDIILSLSSLHELMVISRGSTMAFGRGVVDPQDVGRVLGVEYVLTGTVRRASGRIRVSTDLVHAQSGECLLSEQIESTESDLFDFQDRVVERVVARIAPHVRAEEQRRALRKQPENFTAYDACLRALDLISSMRREEFEQAIGFLEQAMELDQEFAMPAAWAARWHNIRIGQGWSDDVAKDTEKAKQLAARAIQLDRQNALALATYGHVLSFLLADYDTALTYLDRAREVCPNSALAWVLSSATLSYLGRGAESVRCAERGLRLSPFDRNLFYYCSFLGLAHYASGEYADAVKWSRRAFAENALYTSNLRTLAASLAAIGEEEEARQIGARLMELEPGFQLGPWTASGRPFKDPQARAKVAMHLRLAGIPD